MKKYSLECMEYASNLRMEMKKMNKELSNRIYTEIKDDRHRNDFQRDYARVIYSSSFRRLQGKMQLLGIRSDSFYRNRLTHSFEVSQIARAIASKLDYERDEIFVVETCALAHDFGNPPFGHYGEKILNNLSKDIGGFEGNAQTLRILMDIEKKNPNIRGLNLTLRTLLGVIKYFVKRKYDENKFIYDNNYDTLFSKCETINIYPRTLDVQIIDLADEIAYAAHDLEDALRLNLFNIDELLYEFYISNYKDSYNLLVEIVKKAREKAYRGNTYKSSEEYTYLFNKELTSIIVNSLINDIDVVKISDEFKKSRGTIHEEELGFKTLKDLAKGLKEITFKCINRSSSIYIYEKTGEKIITGLYEVYNDKRYNANYRLLPVEYRPNEEMSEKEHKRLIIDYIAGMMDSYAISTYEKYFGKSELEKKYFTSKY